LRPLLASLAVVALVAVGCGSGGDGGTTGSADAPPGAQAGSAQNDPGYEALNALREDGAAAAAGVAGLTREDVSPGENAADLVFESGDIDKSDFCSSLATAAEAEAATQAEAAFAAGWQEKTSPELTGRGGAIFKTLAAACQSPA
jgi:hypothetical protein